MLLAHVLVLINGPCNGECITVTLPGPTLLAFTQLDWLAVELQWLTNRFMIWKNQCLLVISPQSLYMPFSSRILKYFQRGLGAAHFEIPPKLGNEDYLKSL